MSYETIELEFDGGISRLTMNDPETLNAVSPAMIREFIRAVDEIADPANGARCVLWTGKGRGFCSGANLASSGGKDSGTTGSGSEMDAGSVLDATYHPFIRKMRNLDMPVVVALNGVAARLLPVRAFASSTGILLKTQLRSKFSVSGCISATAACLRTSWRALVPSFKSARQSLLANRSGFSIVRGSERTA